VEQEFQAQSGGTGTASVDRAAVLLTRVLTSNGAVGVVELAGDAGLPKSTASRLLGALERHGLVQQDGNRGGFSPGPALVRFAQRGLGDRLVDLAGPPMHALAEATGETINLAVAGAGAVEHLSQLDSRHFVGVGNWVGMQVPYHCTANGKVLLAFGAGALPAGELAAPTGRTITDRDQLAAELARVRAEGVATATDELEIGLTAIAAPVIGDGGSAVAALSVSGPTLRLSPRRLAELRPIVIQQARALGERLGRDHEGEHAA
jgi:IclR family acetate operon transcriptional repressor